MSRQNQWFVLGSDIAREVITADIQRYLGPDALVRPGVGTGELQGQQGYWITAYRTLTSQMIQDLRLDSQRWQQERQPEAGRGGGGGGGVAYQDSQTHAARQAWGPTTPYDGQPQQQQQPPQHASSTYNARHETKPAPRAGYAPQAGYASSSDHYTTTPTPQYAQSPYAPASAQTQPRTTPADPYSGYQPSGQRDSRESAYQTGQYHQAQPTESYARQTPQATSQYPQSPVAAPGYYIASDGRQYPLSQQPQSQSSQSRQGASRYPQQGTR